MQIVKQIFHFGILLIMLTVMGTGCSLDNIDSGDSQIAEQDLQAAGEVLGESLSSDNSGVLLSLNDALTNISGEGFNATQTKTDGSSPTLQNERSGRGSETDYSYSYDSETGIHAVSFRREVSQPLFSKIVTDTLNYLFSDADGNFVEFPDENRSRIETLNYTGNREGEISTLRKNSFFVRTDTFLIGGISDSNPVLEIDGVHNGSGTMAVNSNDGNNSIERSYRLEISLLNIKIEKQANGEIDLRSGVTGTLSWEMELNKEAGGNTDSKIMSGTIKMNGDGTALLRFQNSLKRYQVNLNDGDLKDQESEFEGRIRAVDTTRESVTLVNGRTIYLDENTEIDNDDYTSLEAVNGALNNGIEVWAEGEGYIQNGQFFAEEIEFEREDGDSDDEGNENTFEFEERVTSVDVAAGTFTLAGKAVILIDDNTVIEEDSDLLSIQEVADALNENTIVEADGEAYENTDNAAIDLTAIKVEFEIEEEDED